MKLPLIKQLSELSSRSFIVVGAFGLLLMTVIIFWKVFGRYVLSSTPNWAEQLALVLMIWYICLAAAAGVKEGFHIRIVALENAVSEKMRLGLRVFSHLVVMTCGASMFLWGLQLVLGTWSHAVPTLGIPRGAVYIALPLSGLLMALFSLENIFKEYQPAEAEVEEAR